MWGEFRDKEDTKSEYMLPFGHDQCSHSSPFSFFISIVHAPGHESVVIVRSAADGGFLARTQDADRAPDALYLFARGRTGGYVQIAADEAS